MKKLQKKTKVAIGALSVLCAAGIVAGALALFSTSFNVTNTFKVSTGDAKFVETFLPPKSGEDLAGNTYEKSGQVVNTGTTAVRARAKVEAVWVDNTGTAITPDPNVYDTGKAAATLNFGITASIASGDNFPFAYTATGTANATTWQYDKADSYFYYGGKTGTIAGGASSTKLMESVTFDSGFTETEAGTDAGYYIATQFDTTTNAPKAGATKYATQALATAAAGANEKIYYYSVSKLKYAAFQDATLNVTITGEIKDASEAWS